MLRDVSRLEYLRKYTMLPQPPPPARAAHPLRACAEGEEDPGASIPMPRDVCRQVFCPPSHLHSLQV